MWGASDVSKRFAVVDSALSRPPRLSCTTDINFAILRGYWDRIPRKTRISLSIVMFGGGHSFIHPPSITFAVPPIGRVRLPSLVMRSMSRQFISVTQVTSCSTAVVGMAILCMACRKRILRSVTFIAVPCRFQRVYRGLSFFATLQHRAYVRVDINFSTLIISKIRSLSVWLVIL
ncbi:hypothetical protein CPC08DRAFT_254889 [Agrocybe pediades]|nr:hypothetical protein CPC08DRAFT_254889 [Agrocybe pediades]